MAAQDDLLKQAADICRGCASMGKPTATNGYWKHYDIDTAEHGVPCRAASVWGVALDAENKMHLENMEPAK